jgi:chromosome segregation protein
MPRKATPSWRRSRSTRPTARSPEWGTRRRAFIITGDSRSDTWDLLGVRGCWLKLGEPTIEAVRQALLADEARIAYDPPETPLERLVEVRIKSSLTGDDPLIITFNPGFNVFIGGRGSGKSAVLEYLRFGLGPNPTQPRHGPRHGRA